MKFSFKRREVGQGRIMKDGELRCKDDMFMGPKNKKTMRGGAYKRLVCEILFSGISLPVSL